MAIQVSSQPHQWASAYRPTLFVFESDRSPNTTAGDVDIALLSIQSNQLGVYAVISTQFASANLVAGETINIRLTDGGLYSGNFKVRNAFESSGVVVAYLDTAYVGDDTGGYVSRVLDNFRLAGRVIFDGSGEAVEFELKPDENNQFILDVRDMAARQFKRIFDVTQANVPFGEVRSMDQSIAMGYDVEVWERYTRWVDGIAETFDDKKDTTEKFKGFRTVNCIHPYYRTDPFYFDWSNEITGVMPMGLGTSERRFLTNASRTKQVVGPGEDFYLAFLLNSTDEASIRVIVTSYYQGSPVSVQGATITDLPSYAGLINVGPRVLTILSAFIDSYSVYLWDSASQITSEVITIQYDHTKCGEAYRRLYWRNKWGGLDQFTMEGRETDNPSVARSTLQRPAMDVPSFDIPGSWMERTYRTDPSRNKTLTSKFLPVETMRWLSEDCFESADHALSERTQWWTPVVLTNTEGVAFGTDNVAKRFTVSYRLGVDNMSQRG